MRIGLRSAIVVSLLVIAASPAAAGEIDWVATPPLSGTVDGDEVRIEGPGVHPLVVIDAPDVPGDTYEIGGTLRYEDVGGIGYLEMWSHFSDGGAYFSRTLAEEGELAALSGDSDGRRFLLPFSLNGAQAPERLEVNLVLPEGGTVWIGALELAGLGADTAWFAEQDAGLIGAVGGTLAGLVGAVIGYLGGRLRARRLVEALLVSGLVIGIGLTATAAVALVIGQPYHVWYPLGLIGVILAVVDGALLPAMRSRYQQAELTRIRALDA